MPLADRVKLLEERNLPERPRQLRRKVRARPDHRSHLAASRRPRAACCRSRRTFHRSRQLAKTDLTTELVKEFTELQGTVGGLYARAQGLRADRRSRHLRPIPARLDSDPIPRTVEGAVPRPRRPHRHHRQHVRPRHRATGSKDPFALRRAANAIVKILAESTLPLTLSDVLNTPPHQSLRSPPGTSSSPSASTSISAKPAAQAYDVVKAAWPPVPMTSATSSPAPKPSLRCAAAKTSSPSPPPSSA